MPVGISFISLCVTPKDQDYVISQVASSFKFHNLLVKLVTFTLWFSVIFHLVSTDVWERVCEEGEYPMCFLWVYFLKK